MSTQFLEIYKQNEIIKNDNRLAIKTTNSIYDLYYQYLKFGIGMFIHDCYSDLTDIVPFTQVEYTLISNGTDNQYVLNSPSPPLTNGNFYVGYAPDKDSNYIEITANNYSYNSTTNILTITSPNPIPSGNIIYVSSYIVGQFNSTLSLDCIMILANGMLVPFLQEEQNRNSELSQKVYSGESKIYSQAEHISAVHSVVQDQYDKTKQMIYEYTYKANSEQYKGLGGGLI